MKHFTAIYMMPVQGLEDWMSKPEEERKVAEDKMKADWDLWLEANKESVLNTIGLGKTKRATAEGITDATNGMMLSSYVQAESVEAVSELFKNHPHLGIPGAFIDIMEANQMSGM
jgi:hypothetical protein